MKEDTKEAILVISVFFGMAIFIIALVAAIVGIPAYAIIEIIKAIKS